MANALPPLNVETLAQLAHELRDKKQYAAALATIDRALGIHPDHNYLMLTKGKVLYAARRLDEAVQWFDAVLENDANSDPALHGKALALLDLGRCDEAVKLFEQALRLSPSNAGTRWDMTLTRLLNGQWKRGFEDYEVRLNFLQDRYPRFAMPFWRGEELDGRRIFVHCEQGAGDNFQFARYLPWLASTGAEVVVGMNTKLVPMFKNYPGITTLMGDKRVIPSCDFGVYMMSLPGLHKTTIDNVPADPGHFRRIAQSLKFDLPMKSRGTRKVGICWAGAKIHNHDHLRSARLEDFLPICASVENTVYSFQIGDRQSDVALSGASHLLCDLSEHLTDWSITAAAIMQMDVVVTVDTGFAHMAAALGIPTWIMIGESPDFRWLRTGLGHDTTTPWYPTAKLYRKRFGETWPDVIENVAYDLTLLPLPVRSAGRLITAAQPSFESVAS